ncbi:MAG TPA: sigma 54-interacting transcriptional regulator [Bryobacteraceae bacterium]|nr:sigma 54-interacting transcriptional regulator [Bryobacteraceae bacterium]
MTELSAYVLEAIREGSDLTLYRGRQHGNPSRVLAVALAAEHPSPQGLRRLEHEYSLAAELDSAWAAKPLALIRHEGRTILILTDPGGEPLDLVLQRGQLPDLTCVLHIAIGLATALGQVHRRGLVHKDLKPGNVLVDDAGKVWLTGFAIASRLPHERQPPAPPEIIAGTLAYMAPEQTGRMNRSIDTRSDLYSLGVTLYQMLTGALPFTAADPLEWIHCHIARGPEPPDDLVALPEAVSSLIMKLLAKNAEERYQTAEGLEADLRRCLAEWDSLHRIDPFPLGANDLSDRLLIPEKLYGRESEIETLLTAFDRVVARGAPEVVLISGYSGVGKSSVVNELHKALVPPRGLFGAGKFDQYKRDIPYATLAQAFQTLVRQVLAKSEWELDQWRRALREAVEPNGQLIVNLIPELEFIIGKQPPLPDLPAQDAQNRFQMVFRRFLGVFSRPEHPLALFLDDLQWLDTATLDFLEHLVTHSDVQHLLLIGAYRDNEVSPSHPLLRTLEAIHKARVRVQDILLAPLGINDVGRLLADALRCAPERTRPLAQLVHEKTGGNPFFTIQFFTALVDERLVAFDPIARFWRWDMDRIHARSYTDNVVDLVAAKLKRFSAVTQEALKQLACLGNVAGISTLALVHGETEEEVDAALWEAVRAGLVFRQDDTCKFLHDRIHQAAYSLIPEKHRAGIHLRIGRSLLDSMTPEQLDEQLFDVANQLNRGATLLTDHDEKAQVAAIDLRAGRKAKASAAYASARAYFSAGMVLLDENDWGGQYELAFGLWLERVEAEFLTGNFERAEHLIRELLPHAVSKVDRAAVYNLKVSLHILKSENQQAVDSALACLRLFGIDMPAHPSWDQVQLEYEMVWRALAGRPIEGLIDLPLMTDRELQAAMQVLAVLISPSYFTDFHLYCLHICRMVNVSMQHGTGGASAHAYGYFGFILGPVFHRYRDAHRFARLACDLVEKQGFIACQAKVYYAVGTVAFWTQPIAAAIDFMRTGVRTATEMGDLAFACYCMFQTVTGLLLRTEPLDEIWRQSEIALAFTREAKYRDWVDIMVSQQRFIAAMQGRTATISTFSDAQFDETAFEDGLTEDRVKLLASWYWILKLKARFVSGDYSAALAAADKVKPLLSAAVGQIQLLDYYCYTALAVAASYENASADEQQEWRQLLSAHQEQLREWAENYPPTFADKYMLVSAEIARLERRDSDAMRLYEQAIHHAGESGFIQIEALAHELAARFYAAHSSETSAHAYLHRARNCYDRWGAFGKVKQLDALYPRLYDEHSSASAAVTIGTPLRQLDVATVVKASQALSSEILLPKLIERLMRIVVEHAGAQRGLLILLREDEVWIEAEATTGEGGAQVQVRQKGITLSDVPQSALHYAIRTRERVLLDDASAGSLYSEDAYVRQRRPRSLLCLPIVKQTKLVGVFYLENNLTPGAFTLDRIAVLEVLASQAAISLENASLYSDLQHSEAFLAQGQTLSHTGTFGWGVLSGEIYWSEETYKIFGHDRVTKPTLEWIIQRIHPDDRDRVQQTLDHASKAGVDLDLENRLLMADGSVKHVHVLGRASKTSAENLEFVGAVTDVTAAKRAEAELRYREEELLEAQRLSHTGSWKHDIASGGVIVSPEVYRIFGVRPDEGKSNTDFWLNRNHPEDAKRIQELFETSEVQKTDYEADYRIVLPDGAVKHLHAIGHPVVNEKGDLIKFIGTVMDVTAAKQAEEKIRQSESELRQILELAPQHVYVLGPDPDRTNLYANQAALDYLGLTFEEWRTLRRRLSHPDDWARVMSEAQRNFSSGLPHETELRLPRNDGQYRWFLFRWNPIRDNQGRITRWYVAGTDIEERKQTEQRLQNENVALREEIDKASMFEQIVGTSAPLQMVLARISKVAPTDSGVLITGETGTGKELVARAIHRRSQRSSRAFVSVNCAAIPRELIASELFGHEKGAFTGAIQRRLGRFELAEGGTIFLDEIGELPAETQIALLRVLQEHEFERVGGAGSMRTNVRVIAATNRDLEAGIAAGVFRSDLFYRLNVFPIEVPPLRERKQDIAVLVEYFIDRYARKAGKSFQAVNKKSLDLLQSYSWPGNIRELQNVIERSVIVCETKTFSVDESWLSRRPEPKVQFDFSERLVAQEKEMIEAALRETKGRVFGPSGAAAKLGMPGTTLDSKIKALKINKNRFKTA